MGITKKHHVAIIMRDTLGRLGLELILQNHFDALQVGSFDSFDSYAASADEAFDLAFVDSDIIALYNDFFMSKLASVVPVIHGEEPEISAASEREPLFIYSQWEQPKLIHRLKEALSENRSTLSAVEEKVLSLREIDVLKEVAKGMTNREIADHLHISMNTVMSHRKNITTKLNVKTVSGLTFYALINGLITGDEVVDIAAE